VVSKRKRRPNVFALAADQTRASKHAEVARRYAWAKKRYPPVSRAVIIGRRRLAELERLFRTRYGNTLPDDDAGHDDLLIAAHTIAHLSGNVAARIISWAAIWAPWMPPDNRRRLSEQVLSRPMKFRADPLAWRLALTYAERQRLNITTIGAADVSKAERVRLRESRKVDAKRERRRLAGVEPRAEYQANSLTRTKPWEAENTSRRTWERRRKRACRKSDASKVNLIGGATLASGARAGHVPYPTRTAWSLLAL